MLVEKNNKFVLDVYEIQKAILLYLVKNQLITEEQSSKNAKISMDQNLKAEVHINSSEEINL